MNALPNQFPLLNPTAGRPSVPVEALSMCVRALDPGSRALLDLSLRRKLPFEVMAGVLHTDPFDLARRRARAVARIAAELDLEGAGVVATVKAALARLPDEAWGVPPVEPAPQRAAVQAEAMAEAARALMVKLAEQRTRVREAALAAAADPFEGDDAPEIRASRTADPFEGDEAPEIRASRAAEAQAVVAAEPEAVAAREPVEADPAEQPTVESEAIVLPTEPEVWEPVAATPMAAAFSHHPAFAVERDDVAPGLPPLAVALAQAAASERAAGDAGTSEPAAAAEVAEQPTVETEAIRLPTPRADRPAPPLTDPPAVEREPSRRLARGGLIVGLLLAILRLFFGRR